MATRGIYHKTCPSCATQVPTDVDRCGCGYSFRSDAEVEELPPEELLAQQQLEQEYIKARIVQATENLESLHSALLADPKNFDKANKLMNAFAELRRLRAEFNALSANSTNLLEETNKAIAAGVSAQPSQAFRAVQAQKAEGIMRAAGMKTKECSKCHAVLPERAALCFCGYAFSQTDTQAPASTEVAERREGM